jgi:hypothetical protein
VKAKFNHCGEKYFQAAIYITYIHKCMVRSGIVGNQKAAENKRRKLHSVAAQTMG